MNQLYKKISLGAVMATSLMALTASSSAEETIDISNISISSEAKIEGLERVTQTLVAPPYLPEHNQISVGAPKIVEITMVIEEKELEIASGVFAQAMTFEGTNPGPMIVVHQDDYVELTLVNPKTNSMLHNIDFHASTGALGGGGLTNVAPGQQVKLRFKATKPGVFVYHCAPGGAMIPYHVVTGMNGAIMILPREGLKDDAGKSVSYDKAYYIGEQDWYIPQDADGKFKRYDSPAAAMGETMEIMKNLTPTHLTFNGKVGALTGDKAMKAKVGETVLFIHSQANRDSRVHLIGGHGDLVWHGGSFNDAPATNLETWAVAGGEATAALYTFLQPGLYAYVNHNLIEAILLGAAGHVSVEGEWNNDLMEQVEKPGEIK